MSGWREWWVALWPVDSRPDPVRQQLMQQMAAAHKTGLKVNLPMIFAIAPAYLVWVDWPLVALWLVTVSSLQLLNVANSTSFLRAHQVGLCSGSEVSWWTFRFATCTFFYNCAWASSLLLFWVEGNQSNNFFLLCIIAVSVTPTVLLNSAVLPSIYVSSGVISAFFLATLWFRPLPVSWELAIAYSVFLAGMIAQARRAHTNARDVIEMTLEKNNLIRALSDAKAESDAARANAEDANTAKSQFLANMSHELRTPLNAIIGFSEVLNREVFGPINNEKYLQYSGDIHSSGQHLLALITDILDISKIEAGEYSIAEELVDLQLLADDCHKLLELRASVDDIQIERSFDTDLPLLNGDQRALRQIWLNLLTNAVKFAPRGSRVYMIAERLPDGSFRVGVLDEGPGITREDMEKVLQTFWQGQEGIARPGSGTGLGLTIVKGLAEAHGGRLELKSDVGVGTQAYVIFPAERIVPNDAQGLDRLAKAYP